ncbi:uncharacterized protein LACBIDRAFT_328133 [Laccaria bicolor S238N-H82]|uniref:Predicted protein n=1 Tax=Laccaria bicolor (strain S238N-H82 / ATCC MYA-4686) TaxID=486041 RepID=B0DDV2_LACBS|nr:uncharacterized protein LACBIDRAFT_328133 [Laccaria bicolor S238N-H82]EDR07150.1 predicted protein [Laccaria bicolor S238N-H82]|eukprot:XP_001882081.1 predicted protein [Laccaria bicolor S238N-H82]
MEATDFLKKTTEAFAKASVSGLVLGAWNVWKQEETKVETLKINSKARSWWSISSPTMLGLAYEVSSRISTLISIKWWHDMVVNVKMADMSALAHFAQDEEAYRRPLHHPGMTTTSRQFSDTSAGQDALVLWEVPLPPQYLPRTSHPSSPTSSIHSIYTQYDPNWCTVVPS